MAHLLTTAGGENVLKKKIEYSQLKSVMNTRYGREVDNGFDENPHKHYILGASAHGLHAEQMPEIRHSRRSGLVLPDLP